MNTNILEPVPFSVARHTAGPWIVKRTAVYDAVFAADGDQLITFVAVRGDEEGRANAHLIAAAPELLTALLEVVEQLSLHPDANHGNSKVHYCLHKARAGITRAKGEA